MPEPLFSTGPSFDELIVAIGTRQDRSAFAALFAHFAPRVKAYLLRTGSDPVGADELTQEVMMLVWRKAVHYDPTQAKAATWIFTIARNKRIDKFRRERHIALSPDDPALAPEPEQLPDRRLETAQQARAINAAISPYVAGWLHDRSVLAMACVCGQPSKCSVGREGSTPSPPP